MQSNLLNKGMYFVLLLTFLLGGYTLENMGIKYVSEGGSPLFKIHLYSYTLMLLAVVTVLLHSFSKSLGKLGTLQSSWLISMVCIVVVIMYGLIRFGTSGMAYIIDTMVAPLLALFVLSQLSSQVKQQLLSFLAYLLLFNSCIAILEFISGQGLVNIEFKNFSHFRSTALLTHPLNNALITAALTPILMDKTKLPTLLYFSITFLALFAFGGRAATGIFVLGCAVLMLPKMMNFLTHGIRVSKLRFALIQALAFVSVNALTLILIFTPIGERILSKLHVDGSAQARFDVFIILDQLSVSEWLWGASQSLIDNIEFFIDIKVIENYLIGWIVSFGIMVCLLLTIACYLIPIKLVRNQGAINLMALVIFVLVSLTNNALTTKTPALLLLFCALYLNSHKNISADSR